MFQCFLIGFDRTVSSVQSGRAIQHVKENIFTAEGGVRKGIPNVLVVLTDGRSQDDVNKVSKEMQMEGRNSGVSFPFFLHFFCSRCILVFLSFIDSIYIW